MANAYGGAAEVQTQAIALPRHAARSARDQAFPLCLLALQLAPPAGRIRGCADTAFGGFLVMPSPLHLAEHALPLHLLF